MIITGIKLYLGYAIGSFILASSIAALFAIGVVIHVLYEVYKGRK
jgi:hypothetical protein